MLPFCASTWIKKERDVRCFLRYDSFLPKLLIQVQTYNKIGEKKHRLVRDWERGVVCLFNFFILIISKGTRV